MDLYQVCSNNAPGAKMAPRQGHQGHGQLSTDTYMLALNKTQVSALGPLGPPVLNYRFFLFLKDPFFQIIYCTICTEYSYVYSAHFLLNLIQFHPFLLIRTIQAYRHFF